MGIFSLGPAAPELGWVPAPRYLMRRDRVLRFFGDIRPGRLLEVGSGAGAFLIEMADLGFQCEGLETSSAARDLAQRMAARFEKGIVFHHASAESWQKTFDVVCAFEVLEHIEHDEEALREWVSWLRPGAELILSVPAHMRSWNVRDDWAGHFRRYEKSGLVALLGKAGLVVESCECYGFPLANLIEKISVPLYSGTIIKEAGGARADRQMNNDRSGIDRRHELRIYPLMSSFLGRFVLGSLLAVQGLFVDRDLGNGYLVRARLP